jgi:hypothetical protein
MISDEQIEAGKKATTYKQSEPLHEHNDCIRFAYEWLDAQTKIKGPQQRTFALKHMIEKWAGRYVSTSDVEVAATMHPDIKGVYPWYNISAKLTLPARERISGLGEAFTQGYDKYHQPDDYSRSE